MTPEKTKRNENQLPTLFSDFFDTERFFGNRWFEKEFNQNLPAVNVIENGKEFSLEFAAPGFKKEDFTVNVEDNVLMVSAEKEKESNSENDRFTRREFSYSSFSRSFTLPRTVNSENIDAKYTNGILKLTIPKKEEAKVKPAKQIKVA
jgi:HSP20 family protein